MSVGHVARLLEEGGIPTVIVATAPFRKRLAAMAPPRLLITPHPMGRPLGLPGHQERQRAVLLAAVALLAKAERGGTTVDFSPD